MKIKYFNKIYDVLDILRYFEMDYYLIEDKYGIQKDGTLNICLQV